MSALQPIEDKMDEYLHKKAPIQIPENGRKGLVSFMPWLALIFGVLSLWMAYDLWQLSRRVNEILGVFSTVTVNYGPVYYLSLLVLVVSGVLMVASFSPLKGHKKSGWDLALWGVVVNFIYGVVVAFSGIAGGGGRLIGAIISALIGMYLLAQIRDYYTGKKKISDASPSNTVKSTDKK